MYIRKTFYPRVKLIWQWSLELINKNSSKFSSIPQEVRHRCTQTKKIKTADCNVSVDGADGIIDA